jgi:hypothetical protein
MPIRRVEEFPSFITACGNGAMNDNKRLLREEKRAVKKAGNRHRRRILKRSLEAPESAHEAEPELGRNRSEEWNGLDRVR